MGPVVSLLISCTIPIGRVRKSLDKLCLSIPLNSNIFVIHQCGTVSTLTLTLLPVSKKQRVNIERGPNVVDQDFRHLQERYKERIQNDDSQINKSSLPYLMAT